MNEYIDRLKIKLVTAVDLKKGKINRVTDIYEALKELESFPMTLDILNSSRIGRIVNDIRHFNDAQSDIKSRLKHLIKQWNDKLLPNKNKKLTKPSNSNGCTKASESSNNNFYNNENHKVKHLQHHKLHKSSNNLEIMNGVKKNIKIDCEDSFEVPHKKIRLDNTNKKLYSDSPKTLLKEIHIDSDSCPPIYKSHILSQKHDSPLPLQLSDIKTFIKREEEHNNNNSSPAIKDKQRKRKHDSTTNGVTAIPLQKVKSTRELLAAMGDVVPSDTKKKILCNEIVLEDDLPKSCVPDAVRPKTKVIKPIKTTAQEIYSKTAIKNSPFVSNTNEEFVEFSNTIKVETFDHSEQLERSHSYGSLKENKVINNSLNVIKTSPFTNQNNSPFKNQLKRSPISDPPAQSTAIQIKQEENPLKIKLTMKPPHKKKSKHHDPPPITNLMNDLPVLPDIADFRPDLSKYYYDATDIRSIEYCDEIVELLAHLQWEGYNCTRHPITDQLLGYSERYTVEHLHILSWTDTVNECPSFFPVNTESELAWLESSIGGEYS